MNISFPSRHDRRAASGRDNASISANRALIAGVVISLLLTGLTWLVNPLLPQIDFAPDTGYSHYYWKLPDPTFWTRLSAWGGYLLHQGAMWGIIYYAQKNRLRYTSGMHRLNWIALGVNAAFIVIHLLQTMIWYDGLAQDVSIFSSQASVIIMLVMILHMENQRRGLFFGRKINFLTETGRVARKYHGYIFSWAIIYTFWYHPMENTGGHLLGLLYTFMLLVQGSLFFTRAHLNRWWIVSLELMVLVHGTTVALLSSNSDMWAMFFFGFLTLFVATQMYGLGLSRNWRWGIIAGYIVSVIVVYGSRGWDTLNEIIRIPVIEYGLVFVFAAIIWLGMRLVALVRRPSRTQMAPGD